MNWLVFRLLNMYPYTVALEPTPAFIIPFGVTANPGRNEASSCLDSLRYQVFPSLEKLKYTNKTLSRL